MKALVTKLSHTGALLMDYFAGTIATSKEFILLNRRRKLICFDIDGDCHEVAFGRLLLLFGRQIEVDDWDIPVDYKVEEVARMNVGAMETAEKKG